MTDNVTIVVQARTNSARFPGKVLVDFLGFPLAILAVKRAGSRGHRVVLATSEEDTDDALAESASRHGITIVRGPLSDVLGRFVLALDGRSDDEIVVRLTADNIVPDGDLINEVVEDFEARNLDYIMTTDSTSGLPYGCSVEVTRVGLVRRAAAASRSAFEREHVTPWIRARGNLGVFTRYARVARGHYRCTVDCLDDYIALLAAFPKSVNPISIGWREIIDALDKADGQPTVAYPVEKFIMGTAQLGFPYGIVRSHSPDEAHAARIIKAAIVNGVEWIDTARAYGRSEEVIGKTLANGWAGRCRIVTKLAPLSECSAGADPALAATLAENSLLSSCRALRRSRLDTVLLHRASHLVQWNGAVLAVLRRWRDEGGLGTLGVSVQSPEELQEAVAFDDVEHIQLPFNVIDYRWGNAAETLRKTRRDRRLVIHVRSVFLQGLLLSDSSEAWARAHVADPSPIRGWLLDQASRFGYKDVATLCVAHARAQDWIDGLVIGTDSVEQFLETARCFDQAPLKPDQNNSIDLTRPYVDRRVLDPSKWKRVEEALH